MSESKPLPQVSLQREGNTTITTKTLILVFKTYFSLSFSFERVVCWSREKEILSPKLFEQEEIHKGCFLFKNSTKLNSVSDQKRLKDLTAPFFVSRRDMTLTRPMFAHLGIRQ